MAATFVVNELGDWMAIVALSVLVYDRTESALATSALFIGTGFLPAVLAPLFVTRAEQPTPRVALVTIYCLEAVTFTALAALSDSFSLALVVILAAVDGTLALAGRALTRAVVAALLEPVGELRAGNAVLNVAFTGGAALGPAIAGVVVAGFGVATALLLDAASFCALAVIVISAGTLPQAEPESGSVRERVRAGISYVRHRAPLRRLLMAQGAALIFFAAVLPVEVIYAKETLDAGDSGYGLLLSTWGVGMVIGSIAFAAVRRAPLPYLLFFSTVTVGAGYLGMAAAPSLAFACVGATLGGMGNGVQWVSAVSAVQELTAAAMQARVMSVLESIGTAMPGVGYILGGVVAASLEPRATFLVAGIGVVGTALIAAPLLGTRWASSPAEGGSNKRPSDADGEVMVQLIPVRAAAGPADRPAR